LTQTDLEAAIAQIVAESEAKLALIGITAADEVLIAQDTANKIADIEKEARDKEAAEHQKLMANKLQIAEMYAQSVSNLAETVFSISDRFGKQDEISKDKRARRQFQIHKAMSLSMAIIDGFKAAQASIAQFPPITPLGIASLIASITASVANVTKIATSQYGSKSGSPSTGSGGGGGAAVGGGGAETAGGGAPSFSLFGQGNNQNTTGAAQDAENKSNQLTVKAIVVESDVTSTQNKVKKMQENATL
jgi:hypothetical protein